MTEGELPAGALPEGGLPEAAPETAPETAGPPEAAAAEGAALPEVTTGARFWWAIAIVRENTIEKEEERNQVRKKLPVSDKHPQLVSSSCAAITDPKDATIMESTMLFVRRMFYWVELWL